LKTGLPSAQVDNVTLAQYVHDLGALPKVAKMVNLWAQVMHGLESTEESAGWFIDYCRRNKGFLAIRADDSSGGQHMRFKSGKLTPQIERFIKKK
jgi:monoamine oxidase